MNKVKKMGLSSHAPTPMPRVSAERRNHEGLVGLPCHYRHICAVAGDLVLSIDRGRVSTAALIDHVLERAPGTEGVGARADVAT